MRTSSGGHRTASHVPRDGYRPRLTPRNLMKILAKGQSSTDLIETESHRGISVFGYRHPVKDSGTEPPPRSESSDDRSFLGG